MTASNQTLAPGGWGWPPGYVIAGDVSLPDLPLLKMLDPASRNEALVAAIKPLPCLSLVRVRDLKSKYGLPSATASVVLHRAKETARPPGP